jgi:hypothetical protein
MEAPPHNHPLEPHRPQSTNVSRTLISVLLIGVVLASTTAAVVARRRGEACAVQVRDHLAVLAVNGPSAGHVCAALIAKHPEFWREWVPPHVRRNWDTEENNVAVVCTGTWAPRKYAVYDVSYGIIAGKYGRDLCASLEDHEPASRF